jgi:hypothetical protein
MRTNTGFGERIHSVGSIRSLSLETGFQAPPDAVTPNRCPGVRPKLAKADVRLLEGILLT